MSYLSFPKSSVDFTPNCRSKSDCDIYEYFLMPGKYLFELWGGQGGKPDEVDCCRGGYVAANLTIPKTKKIYIFVGLSGEFGDKNYSTLFNGGGANYIGAGLLKSGTGGSASDVRWSKSLNDRFLVAGAGGGACYGYMNQFFVGGSAGGLNGLKGDGVGFSPGGKGGGQNGNVSSFGVGGYAWAVVFYSGGVVSGYYGGEEPYESGGGGGSSYIDKKYNGTIKDGNDIIIEPSGSYRQGHVGDGHVRISAYVEQIFHQCTGLDISYSYFKLTAMNVLILLLNESD